MIFAYADPPYIGQAQRHYADDPQCAEVDHVALIGKLFTEFPDGWALSCSSPSLPEVFRIIEAFRFHYDGLIAPVRTGAWCKSFCAFKRNVRPAYAWEPLIYWGGRNPMNGHRAEIPRKNGKQITPKDFIVEPITLKKGLIGAKPLTVCHWILDLLNFMSEDELVDLYPGTGIMAIAVAQRRLLAAREVEIVDA